MRHRGAARFLAVVSLGLAGCGTPQTQPADLFVPPGGAQSQVRERRFENVPAQRVSQAAVQVLQDANFLITASEPGLGLVIGTRGGTLKSIGEVGPELRSVLADAFTFGLSGEEPRAVRHFPKGFSVAVSVSPTVSGSAVRVAFYRTITDPGAAVVWIRELPAPEPHQKFFALLAQELSR